MEIHQLRYFVALAEARNFTRAARQVHVSQPSLSQQIKKLEDELGETLVHRRGREASLTEAGESLLGRARRILEDLEDARRAVRDTAQAGERTVTIGAIPTVAPYFLPPVLARCAAARPALRLQVYEDFRGDVLDSVLSGEVEAALVALPLEEPRLEAEPLFEEPLLLALPRAHRLAAAQNIGIAALAGETFALLGDKSSVHAQTEQFFGDHRFSPRIDYRCAQVATVKTLVAAGRAISILPRCCRAADDDGRIVFRPLPGRSPERTVALVRHRRRYRSRGAEQFAGLLRAHVAETLGEGHAAP